MDKKLLVSGMHCQSCISLVKMQLEEAGLEDNISQVNLLEDSKGEVILKNVDDGQIENAILAINSLVDYKVINHD